MKLLTVIALSIVVTLTTVIFVAISTKTTKDPFSRNPPSLSLAPFSLGNPIAAAMLQPFNFKKPTVNSRLPIINTTLKKHVKFKKGDTLTGILIKAGIKNNEASRASITLARLFNPRNIKLGQNITINFDTKVGNARDHNEQPHFSGFSFDPTFKKTIQISKNSDGSFVASEKHKKLREKLVKASGIIHQSLYLAATKNDVPKPAITELIRAFSWDVDFQREVRTGDTFQLMYEEITDINGRVLQTKGILYAELMLSKKQFKLYKHYSEPGSWAYYNAAGHRIEKALMRTPIDGARLSSGYGRRKHPILGYTRMHRGVDFAAPKGTPIFAAGNGKIDFIGRKGAYGKYIKIRHNKTYSTAYAHMQNFAKGMRRGSRVKQGQTIGYVGTTGRSTGPHLHYEILVRNKRTNPLKVRMPLGKKLRGNKLKAFLQVRQRIDDQLSSPDQHAKPLFDR